MDAQRKVLILGATGRTGRRVMAELRDRGVAVRVIVRSADRLPPGVHDDSGLEVVEADLLALTIGELAHQLDRCDTVISCLGHTISVKGVLGPPRDLVERVVRNVRSAVDARARAGIDGRGSTTPVRLILMSSVSVNRPDRADSRRGAGERAFLWGLRAVVPPSRDNQRAADFLVGEVGLEDPNLEWVVVRPDSLTEGESAQYQVHEELVASLARPDHTRMAEVAHFMGELTTDEDLWRRWRGRMPVVVDAPLRA